MEFFETLISIAGRLFLTYKITRLPCVKSDLKIVLSTKYENLFINFKCLIFRKYFR